MLNFIFKKIFQLFGWKVVGNIDPAFRKAIIVVCPHTSWLDFLIGIGARPLISNKIGYLGKAELFKPPFGFIFYGLGGKPLVRSVHQNQVQHVAESFKKYDDLIIAMAPEGTRKDVSKLRTGFYFMALEGGAAIIPCGFDFAKKEVILSQPFMPTGDFKVDMLTHFLPFFKNIDGVKNRSWFKNYTEGIF